MGMSINKILKKIVPEQHAVRYERPQLERAIIVFTPRSGSSWLTSALQNTGLFGFAEEFVNPAMVENLVRQNSCLARTEIDYLNFVEGSFSTPNGIFSLEVTIGDISKFETLDFFEHYAVA